MDHFQKSKAGNLACGDTFMFQKLKEEGRIIGVLSDGLGSGIKASVLSTMTATMAVNYTVMNENILQTAQSIINTLPQDLAKKISYSTFCIFDIGYRGDIKIIEYETPAFCLFRNEKPVKVEKKRISIEREDLKDSFLLISEFPLEKEDRLIFFTDGISQSGMGLPHFPAGWGEQVEDYIADIIRRQPHISALDLSRKIVIQAEKNDQYSLKDDSSCCVVYRRIPRNILICTGPPFHENNDRYLAAKVSNFQGKKILCGGTTASIISRELNIPLKTGTEITDHELPPVSQMEGIDLVTEGILTLSKVTRLLSGESSGKTPVTPGPAEQIVNLLLNSDKITFIVGTRINIAHQDPNLPVELEIRRNVIRNIKYLLETKYLKEVEISYL